MMYVGIDPGKKGGICFLNRQGMIEHIEPISTYENLANLLTASKDIVTHICLEKSQSFTGQGITSTFNYGVGYGIIQGILISVGFKYTLVSPRSWQKHMIINCNHKDPKKKALASANKIFKKKKEFWIPSKRHRVPHDGIIDSALIAEYCRKQYN